MNIPIIGQQETPKFPAKNIQITPNGDVVIQVLLAPDIIASTVILAREEMTQIDQLRKQALMQQQVEMRAVKHALETKSRE